MASTLPESQRAPKHRMRLHVVFGEQGFDCEVRCTDTKAARILRHEFDRVERAGRGFIRFVRTERVYREPSEVHYEFAPRTTPAQGSFQFVVSGRMCRWLTTTIPWSY